MGPAVHTLPSMGQPSVQAVSSQSNTEYCEAHSLPITFGAHDRQAVERGCGVRRSMSAAQLAQDPLRDGFEGIGKGDRRLAQCLVSCFEHRRHVGWHAGLEKAPLEGIYLQSLPGAVRIPRSRLPGLCSGPQPPYHHSSSHHNDSRRLFTLQQRLPPRTSQLTAAVLGLLCTSLEGSSCANWQCLSCPRSCPG